MARVAGVQLEKDSKGRLTYARINLKKHPETLELLSKIGAVEEDEFEKDWAESITGDQLRREMKDRIHRIFSK